MKFSAFGRFLFFILFVALFSHGCGGARQYTQEDLKRLNAREVYGVITKQSLDRLILKDEEGKENAYLTGPLTQYIPHDYRSQEGDRVRLSVQDLRESTGSLNHAVLQLEAVEVPEKNQFISKSLDGKVVAFGDDSLRFLKSLLIQKAGEEEEVLVYVSYRTRAELAGEIYFSSMINWGKSLNKEVEVTLKRVPVRRGNGYIYVADLINFLNVEK